MPQKKNADVFELTRAKAATTIGLLTGLLATLKGLPSTYDKDLQEDKHSVFAAYDSIIAVLTIVTRALPLLKINAQKMESAVDSFSFSTDLADELVQCGMPFRQAHFLTGQVVRYSIDHHKQLTDLSLSEWQQLIPSQEKNWPALFSAPKSVARKRSVGGTAPERVEEQIQIAKNILAIENVCT